ncbi:DUF134 domain-containing protein [Seonamhaeicola sp. NFXS20]|uniref:DUF134 domain-containing protein n=1 Tax=Seonamhaeicola sp. NFXS20 TaxID=2816959 RepID=UPI003B8CC1B4
MPRPEKSRKIHQPPLMKGYKPFGIPMSEIGKINLTFEEYESIRLVLYNNLQQEQAAEKMNISRPTLTRIYNKALKNIAKAFIEGKAIEFNGGNYKLDKIWYRCRQCFNLFENPINKEFCGACKDYGEDGLDNLNNKTMKGLYSNAERKLGKCKKDATALNEHHRCGHKKAHKCNCSKSKQDHDNQTDL